MTENGTAHHTAQADAAPVLIGCSHGTASLTGRAAIRALLDQVRAARPGLEVREAFVDVQEPRLDTVVAGVEGPAVIVPVLLSTGFHVKEDIQGATVRDDVVAAPPLGPHTTLVRLLADRLAPYDLQPQDQVVLAAAGSSDPEAAEAVAAVTRDLAQLLGRGVIASYGAGAHPRVPDAVAQTQVPDGGRVVVASYLLAPGYFLDVVLRSGADVVTEALAPDPALAALVLERYDAAAATLPARVLAGSRG
ncbi:cobalamin biosynthesis protein CbiX [Serinibacter arcticus]|uniref:Cobalamin biosynthesis protein CbiX n=1 Tax=Serinibacter arcticus TaxID=1655435 RepID=A0A2U1ZWN3_9MICO|nr:CbiX/SirB N-terminal domain-containing protein [Serinibacter arcticus]PWD51396.1 cobalamin biosynthesis protein CbiX [Serinibacter arcticus]